jgi:hypothetical protein
MWARSHREGDAGVIIERMTSKATPGGNTYVGPSLASSLAKLVAGLVKAA